MGFPIIYLIVYFPATVVRLLPMFQKTVTFEMVYAAIGIISSDGIFTVLYSAYSRRILGKPIECNCYGSDNSSSSGLSLQSQ